MRTSLGRRVAGGLGVLLVAALTALAMLPKPWSEEMAARRVDPGVVDHVLLWGWLTLAGNAFLLTGLLASLRYWLRSGPVRRVASLDTWVGYAPQLEEAILPQVPDVLAAILELAEY